MSEGDIRLSIEDRKIRLRETIIIRVTATAKGRAVAVAREAARVLELTDVDMDGYYAISVLEGLKYFMEQEYCHVSHTGQVLGREQLYSQIWNNENAYDIDEAVKSQIKNVWGIGYCFLDESKKRIILKRGCR